MATRPEAAPGVREGDVLADKYRVEKVLGVGGMGVVVAAHHVALDTRVAIKFLLPTMLGNRGAVDRFAREARSAVKITSEHVARVFDVGTLPSGVPFIVMEFLEGTDLTVWLRERGRLPIEQAIDFILQACVAVAEAHRLGIVHRDLKPANFFCVRRSDGQLVIKVLDFGISKITGPGQPEAGMSVTKSSAVMGSPLYMSPEQMRSPKEVDSQSDLWALGASLYELLTGRVPFEGESLAELAVKLATQSPEPPRTFRPELPPRLEAVVLKCLQRDRANRYRNVADVAAALAEFAPDRCKPLVERISAIVDATGAAHPARDVHSARVLGEGAAALPRAAPAEGTRSGMTRRKAASGIVGVVLVTGVALAGFRTRSPREPALVTPVDSGPMSAPPAASAEGGVSAAEPASIVPESPLPAPTTSKPVPTVPSTVAPPAGGSPRPAPTETKGRSPATSMPAAPSGPSPAPAASRPDCHPPFYFDAKNARVFKKECLP